MNPENKLAYICIAIAAFLIGLACPFSFNDFRFYNTLSLSDVIGYLVTIILALYLAHVVERNREQKKAIITVVSNMIQSLINECEDIQREIYSQNLNYSRAVALPKTISTTCKQISEILERAGAGCKETQEDLNKFNRLIALRKALTDTSDPSQSKSPDALLVKNNIIYTIGPDRINKIQREIYSIRKGLFALSVDINL